MKPVKAFAQEQSGSHSDITTVYIPQEGDCIIADIIPLDQTLEGFEFNSRFNTKQLEDPTPPCIPAITLSQEAVDLLRALITLRKLTAETLTKELKKAVK